MKNSIKTIMIVLSCLIISGNLIAQKIKTYKLQMPSIILKNGGPIYVDYLDNPAPDANVGKLKSEFRKAMIKGINADGLVVEQGLPTLNPWMTTKIYETTDNKEDANYIIDGEYKYETDINKSHKAHMTKDKYGKGEIPVHFYEYTASSNAKLEGKVFIKDNNSDEIVKEYPFSKTQSDSENKYMKKPRVKSPANFFSSLNNAVIADYRYMLNPIKREYKYNFPRITPDNRDHRKKFRKSRRKLRKLDNDDNVKEMADILFELQKLEDNNEDVNLGLGMCYEIIGNYTKAKEHYEKSGDSDAMARINEQIQIRDQLKALGVEINEPGL
ncbi:MAG: hypothetical protein ACQES1_05265 [Bacteroidota bacterium]